MSAPQADPPKVSCLVPHWNRADDMAAFLVAMGNQRERDFEVLIHDDGSSPDDFASLRGHLAALGPRARVTHFWRHERAYPDHPPAGHPGLAQWSRMFNALFAKSRGEIVGVLACDWRPAPDFIEQIITTLVRLGPGNMILGDRTNQKETKALFPVGATSGVYRLGRFYQGDTGFQHFTWRQNWLPWDEAFDTFGFSHQFPYWLAETWRSGVALWLCLDMHAEEHVHDNPPEFVDQVVAATPYYNERVQALGV